MRSDQSFVLTWTLLSSGRHWGPQASPPLVEILAEQHESNRIRRGLAWPRETIGTGSRKVGTGSASHDSTVGRLPSERGPKMPPGHLGKRQRVHGVAEGPGAGGRVAPASLSPLSLYTCGFLCLM